MVLRQRQRRSAAHRPCQHRGVLPAPHRAADACRRRAARPLRRALRYDVPGAGDVRARRGDGARAPGRRQGRRRGRAPSRAADGDLHPGLHPDGGDRGAAGRHPAVVPALLAAQRRARRLLRTSCRGHRCRGDRGHPRHAPARLAGARPGPRLPAVRATRGAGAVPQRPGVPGYGRSAGRAAVGADAEADAVRRTCAGVDGEALPGRPGRRTCARPCRARPSTRSPRTSRGRR